MRRVAQELGAGTMTLYNYVRTKDELVALMDDHLMGELLVPEEELARPWREAFSAVLRRSCQIRAQHPWSLTALQNAGMGRNAVRHAEQTLTALETAQRGRAPGRSRRIAVALVWNSRAPRNKLWQWRSVI